MTNPSITAESLAHLADRARHRANEADEIAWQKVCAAMRATIIREVRENLLLTFTFTEKRAPTEREDSRARIVTDAEQGLLLDIAEHLKREAEWAEKS